MRQRLVLLPAGLLAALLATVLALPAAAQTGTVVPPSAFRDYAEGYTLYFERAGEPAGAETFSPDGRVTWQTPQGQCLDGLWRAYDDELCFYYGFGTTVQCWRVLEDEKGLKVESTDDGEAPAGLTYRIIRRDRRPLLCGGPGVRTRARPDTPRLSPRGPRPARW